MNTEITKITERIFIIITLLLIFIMFAAVIAGVIYSYQHPEERGDYKLNKWCIEQGYEKGVWGVPSYCEKIVGETIYRKEVRDYSGKAGGFEFKFIVRENYG